MSDFDVDCSGEFVMFNGDFNEITVLDCNLMSPTLPLWYYFEELFCENVKNPSPIRVGNLLINGELWKCTLNATHCYPPMDYSGYGDWRVDEITITDKEVIPNAR